jgi:hypothetical protein
MPAKMEWALAPAGNLATQNPPHAPCQRSLEDRAIELAEQELWRKRYSRRRG